MTLLCGDARSGKTSLLVRGVLPLLRRRRSDTALSTRGEPPRIDLQFADRRSRNAEDPNEIVVYFDAWRTAPLMGLHDHIDAALRVAHIDPEWHRESLPDRVESLGSRFGLRFLFVFDRFDVFLGMAVGAAHGSRLLDELQQLLNLPSHVGAVFAIRSEAREPFDRFAQQVSFVSAEVIELPHWDEPEAATELPAVAEVAAEASWPVPVAAPSTSAAPEQHAAHAAPPTAPARSEPPARLRVESKPETAPPLASLTALSTERAFEPATGRTLEPEPRSRPNSEMARAGHAGSRWPRWAGAAMACAAIGALLLWLDPPARDLSPQVVADAVHAVSKPITVIAPREAAPPTTVVVGKTTPPPTTTPSVSPLNSSPTPTPTPPVAVVIPAVPVTTPVPPVAAVPALPKVRLLVEGEPATRHRLPDQLAVALATDGGVDLQIRQADSVVAALGRPADEPQVAIVRYDKLRAAHGAGGGNGGKPLLAILAPLYTENIYFIARADSPLAFIHQLEGRRINIGPATGGRALTATNLYRRMFGKPLPQTPDTALDAREAISRLAAGQGLDAVMLAGPTLPNWLAELPSASRRGLKLLKLDAEQPAASKALQTYLPATLYLSGEIGPTGSDEAVPTLASLAFLVTTAGADTPKREALARLAKTLCSSLSALQREGDAKWREVQPGLQLDTGWPTSASARALSGSCARGGDDVSLGQQADRQVDKQADRQADKQADRRTKRTTRPTT